jgi:hypothetical protein
MNVRKPSFWEQFSLFATILGLLVLYVVAAKFWF